MPFENAQLVSELNPLFPLGSDPVGEGDNHIRQLKSVLQQFYSVGFFEFLRRSYAEAGYTLVAGSFELGGTLNSLSDVLLHETSGKAYSGAGPFPQGVAAGTSPASPGYVDQSGKLLRQQTASVSFVFDDAYESVRSVLKPLFDTYDAKFGVAVPVASLGNPNRLTLETLRDMAAQGYEVLNHAASGDVMSTTAKGIGGVKGELATCWAMLNNIGIKATGFQTPSSSLHTSFLDAVDQFSDYAFTIGNTQTLLPYGTPANKLYRFSIEEATQTECEAVVDSLSKTNGAVVFYAHDIVSADANYNKIVAILNRCASLGIGVLTPRQCIGQSVISLPAKVKEFVEGPLIDNIVNNYTATGGATLAVGPNKDITVTIPSAGEFLVQKTINLTNKDDANDLITYSATLRDLTGGIVDNCAIAMKFYDAVDGGGSLILSTTEEQTSLNNQDVRYYAEAVKGLAKSALIYVRLITNAAGSVLIRQPVVRYGTSVMPLKYIDNVPVNFQATIPSQSIAFGVGYVDVTLTDQASNGLFAIASNRLVFQRSAMVSVTFSIVASGTGVGSGWLGGNAAVLYAGSTVCIGPVAGGNNKLSGYSSITIEVDAGTQIGCRALAEGIALAIGSANSRIFVSEIK